MWFNPCDDTASRWCSSWCNLELVLGHVRIDFFGPGQNSALQIQDVGEAFFPEKCLRLQTAHAAFAMYDNFAILVQLLKSPGQLGQRNQSTLGQSAELKLFRISHVQDEKRLFPIEPILEFID